MDEWTKGLHRRGEYYEGWVENVDELLSAHSAATVTCYGTRRSSGTQSAENKENEPIMKKKESKVTTSHIPEIKE